MAAPPLTVEVLFDGNSEFYRFFTVGTSVVGGPDPIPSAQTWVDITTDVHRLSIDRGGRQRDVDQFPRGTSKVVLNDRSRKYDPNNADSLYYGNIEPRKRIRVKATVGGTEYPLYDGYVQSWQTRYEQDILPRVTAEAVDAFTHLAKQDLAEISAAHGGEFPGTRIGRVLDLPEVDWPADRRNLDIGLTELAATTLGMNALAYLRKVALTELGDLFIDVNGDVRFIERNGRDIDVQATFSDDGAGIPYLEVEPEFDSELLINRAVVSGASGVEQTVTDASSADAYGVATETRTGLFMDADADALNQARFLVGKGKVPEERFRRIRVQVAGLTTAQQQTVLGLELADRINIEKTPPGSGNPTQTVLAGVIDGLHWERPNASDMRLIIDVSAGPSVLPFTVGDAQLGVVGGQAVIAY